jgi:hypothetical protein
MPRNGSGVYGPPAGTTAVPNTPIESAKYNAFVADAAEALTNSINAQGTAPFQANQPMGGFKHTNMGAGSNSGDSVNLGQSQANIVGHAASVGGTADAITATFAPAFSAYTAKMRFRFTATGSNTVTAPTINVDGLGAKTLKKLNGVALGIGDIQGARHICDCVYDGTDVILLNPGLVLSTAANVYTAKQTFNGPMVYGQTILTDAATIAWDLSSGGPNYKVIITSNRALGAFSGSAVGQEGFLTVAQDGIGGWSLDLSNFVYDFYGGFTENIARGANDETVYHYLVMSPASMFLKRMGATSIGGTGKHLLDVKTATASATIDFTLTKWLQLYDRFEIDLEDILPATNNVAFALRTSSNGGSSYDAGGSDYGWTAVRVTTDAQDRRSDSNNSQITLADNDVNNGLSNVAGESLAGKVVLHNPHAATFTKVTWDAGYFSDSTSTFMARVSGFGARLASADVDAIRFFTSSGNIASGSFRLYGIGK